jgi:hypothetical protein
MSLKPAPHFVRRLLLVSLIAAAFVVAWATLFRQSGDPSVVEAAPPGKTEPQVLFDKWPQDRKPDLVIVISGQTYGYLQKCGCSSPQKGGLDRRYNFIESLKARGWEVIGLDVGDVPRPLPYSPTSEQALTKYEVAMQAMKMMEYKAVGVGQEELSMPLLSALTKYTLQNGNEYPKVHASNVSNRDDFPGNKGGSALTESDILTSKSGVSVGVISVAGAELIQKGVDRSVRYGQTGPIVSGILNDWKKAKKMPHVNVLLYQGPFEWTDPATGKRTDAQTAAQGFPQFHVILCKTPDGSDGPNAPTVVEGEDPDKTKSATMICQVGQKGQSVGVIGVFKNDDGIGLYYQRVTMSEEFETPVGKEKDNPILKLLQDYSDTVRDNDFMSEMARRKKPHVLQATHKDAQFVGDKQCAECHKAEMAAYAKSGHSHAYDALAKIAKNPVGRQFDGECIICHTVGYEYQTGYLNEKTTAHLKNVQCENCHGPGSLHVIEEAGNKGKRERSQTHKYAQLLSPWKVGGKGMMPSPDKLAAMLKEKDRSKRESMLNESEYRVYLSVYQMCARCHDIDNDPKFDLAAYWPNVSHTGLKK